MSTLKNQVKSTTAAAFFFLALAGAAQAGVIIVDEPTSAPHRVAAANYRVCQDTGADLRTTLLQRRAEGADIGVTIPARPVPPATPIPATRATPVRALALVVGVAY